MRSQLNGKMSQFPTKFERIATAKDYDGSLGERAVTVDVNFTRMVIDDIEKVFHPLNHLN